MFLAIGLAIVALALFIAWTTHWRALRTTMFVGAGLAVGSWFPLLIGIALDPEGRVIGNALGLGLLAWFGSALGLLIILVGLIMWLVKRA